MNFPIQAPAVTDMVGYLNYLLTGNLGINALTVSELGLNPQYEVNDVLRIAGTPELTVGAPAEHCGWVTAEAGRHTYMPPGTPVCYGCPDSFASVLGSGLREEGALMLYLGTFGSLLQLSKRIDRVVHERVHPMLPYTWLLSVPRFGPTIERFAETMFPGLHVEVRLRLLDISATAAQPGAGGFVLRLPIWDSIGNERGRYRLHHPRKVASSTLNQKSRAVLESLGYAVRALTPFDQLDAAVYVAGGGAASKPWLRILADVLDRELIVRSWSNTARGSAEIAGWSIDGDRLKPQLALSMRAIRPSSRNKAAIDHNMRLAREVYALR